MSVLNQGFLVSFGVSNTFEYNTKSIHSIPRLKSTTIIRMKSLGYLLYYHPFILISVLLLTIVSTDGDNALLYEYFPLNIISFT